EGAGLVAEPLGVVLVLGHLEHLRLGGARPLAEQGHGGGAAAEAAQHLPAAVEPVALLGGERVDGVGGVVLGGGGGGELVEDVVEQLEQLANGGAAGRDRVGGGVDEGVELLGQVVGA